MTGDDVRKTVIAVAVALGVLLAPAGSAAQRQPGPASLRVSVLPFLSYAPFFIAAEEGYFGEQNLEIEFVKLARSAEAVVALAQGQLDVAGALVNVAMLNAVSQGARVRLVADRGHILPTGCVYATLLARRDLVEGGKLERLAQLKGLRFSLNEASLEGYYVEKLLGTAGLSLQDVTIADLPDAAMSAALGNAAVDLVSTAEPWVTRLLKSGHATVWMPMQRVIPDAQFAVLLYGSNLLDRNVEAGKRFMVAYQKAVRQYALGKTERNLDLLAKHTGLDRGLLQDACWPPIRGDGRINVEAVLDFQAWAARKRLLDAPVSQKEFWDPRFVDHANAVLDAPKPAR